MRHFLMLCCFFTAMTLSAQSVDYDKVADRIVNQSLQVIEGETVAIYGNPNSIDIMEAVYVAVAKAGGIPIIGLSLPDAEARISKEVKPEFLAQPYWPNAVMNRMADCIVSIDSEDNPDRWSELTMEVREAFRESGKLNRKISTHHRARVVTLGQTDGMPTPQIAQVFGADYEQMKNNFWEAVSVDYDVLSVNANKLLTRLKPGSKVKVTTPYGTDISFTLHNGTPMVSCGNTMDQKRARGDNYAWLPAGDVFTAIDQASANGTIVLPAYYWGSKKYTNVKLTFKNGEIQDITADQDFAERKKVILAAGKDQAMLSSLDLGVNPASKTVGDYRSFEMLGMVTLGIGDNFWAGGTYDGATNFFFHLQNATLQVDGKAVVSNGNLN